MGEIIGDSKGKEYGIAIGGATYDTVILAASFYHAASSIGTELINTLDYKMPFLLRSKLFSIKNGYGVKIGNCLELLYLNPNASGGLGGTIFSYKGLLGKLRLDWDPSHGFHFHPPGH